MEKGTLQILITFVSMPFDLYGISSKFDLLMNEVVHFYVFEIEVIGTQSLKLISVISYRLGSRLTMKKFPIHRLLVIIWQKVLSHEHFESFPKNGLVLCSIHPRITCM